jgi:uncharacterized membrane protein
MIKLVIFLIVLIVLLFFGDDIDRLERNSHKNIWHSRIFTVIKIILIMCLIYMILEVGGLLNEILKLFK